MSDGHIPEVFHKAVPDDAYRDSFISICVGCYRLSAFGVDAFTCMNLGISGFLGMSFGTWQLIMNGCILIVVFLTVRKCIGAGTIVNMVFVGYGADFICWLTQEALRIHMSPAYENSSPGHRMPVCRLRRGILYGGRDGDCAL